MTERPLDELFARFARTGDPAALEAVFERSRERLQHKARRWLGDAAWAEDLVQDLFLALFVHGTTYRGDRPCLPFLDGALRRRASTWRLHQFRRQRREAVPRGTAGQEPPVTAAAANELRAAVRAALPGISPANRDVLARFLEAHESPPEIARALGRPVETVRVQLHRGLRQLRDQLPKGVLALPLLLLLRPTPAAPPLPWWRPRGALTAAVVVVGAAALVAFPSTGRERIEVRIAPAEVVEAAAPSSSSPSTPQPRQLANEAGRGGADVVWQVRHAAGGPAVGVVVRMAPAGHDVDFHARTQITDASGCAAFHDLRFGEWVLRTDRGTRTRCQLAAGGAARFMTTLPAGVDVRGRVVDAEGAPVAGAGVWLSHEPGEPWDGAIVACSGPDGSFALAALAPMSAVGAIVAGRVPAALQTVTADRRHDLELRIGGAAASIAGQVVDQQGRPVARASVRAARHARSQFRMPGGERWLELHPALATITDDAGAFVCSDLPPGRLEVSVRAPGFAPRLAIVHAVAGTASPVRIVLPPGAAIEGALFAPDGAPLADAEVLAHGSARHQWAGVDTASDGSFRLEGLDARRLVVAARAAGFAPRELALAAPPAEPLELELAPLPVTRGRFVARDGEALDASAWDLGGRYGPDRVQQPPSPEPVALTADGAFTTAFGEGVEWFCRPRGEAVWLRCDREAQGEELRLTPPADHAQRGVLRVRLRGASAVAHADAHVICVRDGETYRTDAAAPAAGALALVTLPVGAYTVHLRGRSGRCPPLDAGRIEVTVEGVTVDVEMPPHGTLAWTLLGPPHALERCSGFVLDARDVAFPLPAMQGRMALPAGSYRLWAAGLSFMTVRGLPFTIDAGLTTTLDVPLRDGPVRHVAFRLPDDVDRALLASRIVCRGEPVVGGEHGVHDRGFDCTADGAGIVAATLAADSYTLVVAAGARWWRGTFVVGGDDGVDEPVWVTLVEEPSRG